MELETKLKLTTILKTCFVKNESQQDALNKMQAEGHDLIEIAEFFMLGRDEHFKLFKQVKVDGEEEVAAGYEEDNVKYLKMAVIFKFCHANDIGPEHAWKLMSELAKADPIEMVCFIAKSPIEQEVLFLQAVSKGIHVEMRTEIIKRREEREANEKQK